MTQYFLACECTPYLFDTESGRIFRLQQAEIIDVTHTAVPGRLRLNAVEISRQEALCMAGLSDDDVDLLTGVVETCLDRFAGERLSPGVSDLANSSAGSSIAS